MIRIGLDIDDVLADFMGTYLNRFGIPKQDSEITKNVSQILKTDKDFWLNLPVINSIDFIPELYCTKRVNPKDWTRKWLISNGFPNRNIYQVICQIRNKADFIKGRVDVFVDDSVSNFIKMNLAGVPCLLLDKEYNQNWGPIGRLYSLDKKSIENTYNLFIETIFPNFKSLL